MRVEFNLDPRPQITPIIHGPVERNIRAVQEETAVFAAINAGLGVPGRTLPGKSLDARMAGPAVKAEISAMAHGIRETVEGMKNQGAAAGRVPVADAKGTGQAVALGKNAANIMAYARQAEIDLMDTAVTMQDVTLNAGLMSVTQTFQALQTRLGLPRG